MEFKYRYAMSPVDFWDGMPTLEDLIASRALATGPFSDDRSSTYETGIVFECLQMVGPIRSSREVRLLLCPEDGQNDISLIAVFIKEDNNGTVQVFAKHAMPWLGPLSC